MKSLENFSEADSFSEINIRYIKIDKKNKVSF